MLVKWFVVTPVDPVQNVQCPISSHKKHIISSQVLYLPVSLQYNQLRKDCNTFQVNREQPKEVDRFDAELVLDEVRDEGNDCAGQYCKFVVEEGVLGFVISSFEWLSEADGVDDHSS